MSARVLNAAGFAICAGLLGYAYYLQFYEYLDPCPLCIFQRVGVIALGVVFLVAALLGGGRVAGRVYAALAALAALGGGAIAARHVYLQGLPPEAIPECGPGLEFMLRTMPLGDTLREVFTASGECAEISWTFAGLSMPAWVLIWFVILGLYGVIVNARGAGR